MNIKLLPLIQPKSLQTEKGEVSKKRVEWPRGERDEREKNGENERGRSGTKEKEWSLQQCPLDESDMSYLLAALPGNLH